MADLNIVYKIAADISGLQSGVNKAADSMGRLETLASRAATVFAGVFTAQAAISFGKALLDDADALVKMSDKTGVSIQNLQRFQVAADDAGNTVEDLSHAINQMQNRLESGAASEAISQLGLSVANLKGLKPEEQFYQIADAIRAVQDPAEQTRFAIEIFGKSGAEILPTIKRGFDDVKNAAIGMSESTVKTLDAAGDALKRYETQAKGLAANVLVGLVKAFDSFGTALQDGAKQADDQAKHLKALADETQNEIKAVEDHTRALFGFIGPQEDAATHAKIYEQTLRDQEEQIKRTQQAQERWNSSIEDMTIQMNLSTFTLHKFGAVELPNVHSSLEGVDTEIHNLSSRTLPDFGINIYNVGQRGVASFGDLRTSAQKASEYIAKAFQEIPMMIADIIRSGDFTGGLINIGSYMGATIGKAIGGPLGEAVGSLLPIIGQEIANFFGKIFTFGKDTTHKVIDELLAAIKQAQDALNNIHTNSGSSSGSSTGTTHTPPPGGIQIPDTLPPTGQDFPTGGVLEFATGGIATSGGKDRIPALLSDGEMVLTPDQQRGMGGIRIGSIQVSVSATDGTNPQELGENMIEALRANARVYAAVATVAQRATA